MRKKEIVATYIKKKIKSGEWIVGNAIPSEPVLAQIIGVSRMSIREGIEQLANQGVLEKRQGVGTFVQEITPTISFNDLCPDIKLHTEGYKEILEVRIVLESLALKKAFLINKIKLEKSLEKAINKMKNFVSDDNFIDFDMNFHVEIAKFSENKLLLGLLNLTSSALKVHKKNSEYRHIDNHTRIKEHEKILFSIRENDLKNAQKFLVQHLEKALKKIEE